MIIVVQYVNATALPSMLYQPLATPMFGHGSTSMLYPTLAVLQPTLLPSSLTAGNLGVPVQATSDITSPTVLVNKKQYKSVEVIFITIEIMLRFVYVFHIPLLCSGYIQ
jgi:hypothetical protein